MSRHACGDCGKPFGSQTRLKRHRDAVHLKMRLHVCKNALDNGEPCPATFRSEGGLHRHVNTKHLRLDRFACTHDAGAGGGAPCTRRFVTAGDLRRHVDTVHLKVQPFACECCPLLFGDAGHLKRHVETVHLKQQSCVCTHLGDAGAPCGAVFGRSDGLLRHVRTQHFGDYRRERKLKQAAVEQLLQEHGYPFAREHYVNFTCAVLDTTWAYCDAVLLFRNTVVILEVDEEQHRAYGVSCDVRRMGLIVESLRLDGNTQRVVFVRFNPDGLAVDGAPRRTPRARRHEALVSLLRELEAEPADAAL